jgi:hypothetical protein
MMLFHVELFLWGFVYPNAGRGRCPHPQTFFKEKSLTKNLFNRLIFVLLRALPFALPKLAYDERAKITARSSGAGENSPG